MGQCYEKNKIHILKWKENNKEKQREITRQWMKAHYVSKLAYSFEHQCRKFRAISI